MGVGSLIIINPSARIGNWTIRITNIVNNNALNLDWLLLSMSISLIFLWKILASFAKNLCALCVKQLAFFSRKVRRDNKRQERKVYNLVLKSIILLHFIILFCSLFSDHFQHRSIQSVIITII